jgi:RNA polymerase sigma-70 factor (ECF subfamily)
MHERMRTEMSDTDAVKAVIEGDRDRYSELVERYQKMVYGIAWSHLGDAGLCEDAAQETFIKAFRYLAALRNPEKFSGWLARIARNVSTSLLRKRGRELDKHKR